MQSQGISSYTTGQSLFIRKPPELVASYFYNPQTDKVKYFPSSLPQQKPSHQIHEPISPLIPATPPTSPADLPTNNQNTQKTSTKDDGIQTEDIQEPQSTSQPIQAPVQPIPTQAAVQPTTGNSVVINIGVPFEQFQAPTTAVTSSNSNTSAPAPSGSSSSEPASTTPEAPQVPLPMLPAPNGITIPPPPQENATTTTNTNNQNKNCCAGCGNCMSCGTCTPASKTYLIYATIAVCASLMIALVPTLIAVLVKPKS